MAIIKKEARDPSRCDFYIYLNVHYDTGVRVPFYVGKGSNGRAESLRGRNQFWRRIVKKHGYVTEIVESGLTEDAAFALECHLIKIIGRRNLGLGPLVNLTDGGEGMSGYVLSDETKAKMSATTTGRTLSEDHRRAIAEGRTGMKFTDEHRENMSKSRLGKPSHWRGKKRRSRTPEEKKVLSTKLAGRRLSDETRAKMSAARRLVLAQKALNSPCVTS